MEKKIVVGKYDGYTNSELKQEIVKLNEQLEFQKEKTRRLEWIFGLTGGPAFVEKMETKDNVRQNRSSLNKDIDKNP